MLEASRRQLIQGIRTLELQRQRETLTKNQHPVWHSAERVSMRGVRIHCSLTSPMFKAE